MALYECFVFKTKVFVSRALPHCQHSFNYLFVLNLTVRPESPHSDSLTALCAGFPETGQVVECVQVSPVLKEGEQGSMGVRLFSNFLSVLTN